PLGRERSLPRGPAGCRRSYIAFRAERRDATALRPPPPRPVRGYFVPEGETPARHRGRADAPHPAPPPGETRGRAPSEERRESAPALSTAPPCRAVRAAPRADASS